jgi:hypothetical protein
MSVMASGRCGAASACTCACCCRPQRDPTSIASAAAAPTAVPSGPRVPPTHFAYSWLGAGTVPRGHTEYSWRGPHQQEESATNQHRSGTLEDCAETTETYALSAESEAQHEHEHEHEHEHAAASRTEERRRDRGRRSSETNARLMGPDTAVQLATDALARRCSSNAPTTGLWLASAQPQRLRRVVIGLGSGRCGTQSLAELLSAQPDCLAEHEMIVGSSMLEWEARKLAGQRCACRAHPTHSCSASDGNAYCMAP